MVTKYQMISYLAEDTAKEIAKNGQEWTRYLTTAARLYKYPFNEQILIFAQRPDATACASLELWNEKMNCWVNRGAKGIALLDTENSYTRLKYVFDVSDVHKARRIGRDPNLWELREEHKETVLAQLEKTYGETDKNSSFEQRIMEISNRIALDYYEELLPEIEYVKEGSFLEELDELNVGVRLRDTLSSSIAYTILSRCGADMELWKDEQGFEYISDFNTMKTLSVVGTATTDMCKPLLMEIGRTIGAYDRQIARRKAQEKANAGRTQTSLENTEKVLANEADTDYNALKRESEKELQNNQEIEIQSKKEDAAHETDIRKERGLSDSEPDSERGTGGNADEVRYDAEELLTGTPERDLSGHDTGGRAESTLSGDTGAGRAENGSPERTDGESRGSERGTESSRSDEVGSEDEQHQTFSGGDRADGTDLQLENDIQEEEIPEPDSGEHSLSGSFFPKLSETEQGEDLQRGILCSDEFLKHKRPEIAGYFQIEQDAKIQADYLRNSFRMEEYTEFNIGEMRGGYRADEDGITLWKGNYLTREAESRLSWEEARFLVNSYMEDGVYLLPGETAERIETAGMYQQLDLFSMFTEQAGNLAMKQAETVTPIRSETKIPPEQIADILRSGGGRDNSRKRIYTKYQQGKTPEEMAAFLQKEYGTTGKGFEFDGKQLAVWFNEDGMRVGYGTSTERPVLQMNWQEVEAKIRSQVVNGTYMGANEAYLTDEAERDRIAGHLFFFFRDGMGELPEELGLKAGNYPEAHARMIEYLSTKEGVELVASHMDQALHQLETGEKKLRFRSVMPKEELREELDNKQKFIGQIMTSKSPVRSCEDVDEAALSYAEVKALATGNPYIKEKMDLDIQVSKLKLMKANHTSQKYRLEDNIAKHYPQQITILKERISGLQADIQTAKTNLPADKEFFSMRVGNKVYTDKKEAGTALVEMCKEIKSVNAPAVIGEYAGFKMAVSFDSFNHKFVMNIKGQLSHNLEIGVDPLGNISRINHALEAMTKELAEASTKLENVERQLETAKVEVTKPFAQEAELSEKLDRLSALNALLNMDEKGDDGIGMEDDKSELGTEQVADTRKPYPIENTRHNYAVENGNPQGMRLTAAMADKPAQRVSLKEKLETMKVKAAGNNIENSVQRDKGKEEYL